MLRLLLVCLAMTACSSSGEPDAPGPSDAPRRDTPAPDAAGEDVPATGEDAPVTLDTPATEDAGGVRPGACDPAIEPPVPGSQVARPKGSTCAALGYYEYVPEDYASRDDWPLIIAFHGDGERGNGTTELSLLLNTGLTQQIESDTWDPGHRFVVLSPQMDDRGGLPERRGSSVRDFIAFASANYRVDLHRIYLTGLSGGGAPIYNYLSDEAGGVVAAVVPVCGWYSTRGAECSWASTVPVWYFHGSADGTVPPAEHSSVSYANATACSPGPLDARYSLFEGSGHFIWNDVYNGGGMTFPLVAPGTTPFSEPIYDWMLRYRR